MAIEVVAAIIQDPAVAFLCAKRSSWKDAAGKWEFPGGKLNPGESAETALVREIKEELGVEIKVLRLFDRSVTVLGDSEIDLACYSCELIGEKPTTSTDHSELSWVSEPELSKLDWAEPDLPAIKKLLIPFC